MIEKFLLFNGFTKKEEGVFLKPNEALLVVKTTDYVFWKKMAIDARIFSELDFQIFEAANTLQAPC